MANQRVRRRGARGAGRRRVEWVGTTSNDAVTLAANTTLAIDLNKSAAIENLGSPTLVRTHSHLTIVCQAGVALDDVAVGVGIAIVNSQAAGTAASLPSPITEIEFPWLFHATKGLRFFEAPTAATDATQWAPNGLSLWDLPIDSKSMRKLSAEEEIVLMVETANGAGTAGVQLSPFVVRLLLMQ